MGESIVTIFVCHVTIEKDNGDEAFCTNRFCSSEFKIIKKNVVNKRHVQRIKKFCFVKVKELGKMNAISLRSISLFVLLITFNFRQLLRKIGP